MSARIYVKYEVETEPCYRRDQDMGKAIKAALEDDDVAAVRYLNEAQADIEEVVSKRLIDILPIQFFKIPLGLKVRP